MWNTGPAFKDFYGATPEHSSKKKPVLLWRKRLRRKAEAD
jgi:hypothetical protein